MVGGSAGAETNDRPRGSSLPTLGPCSASTADATCSGRSLDSSLAPGIAAVGSPARCRTARPAPAAWPASASTVTTWPAARPSASTVETSLAAACVVAHRLARRRRPRPRRAVRRAPRRPSRRRPRLPAWRRRRRRPALVEPPSGGPVDEQHQVCRGGSTRPVGRHRLAVSRPPRIVVAARSTRAPPRPGRCRRRGRSGRRSARRSWRPVGTLPSGSWLASWVPSSSTSCLSPTSTSAVPARSVPPTRAAGDARPASRAR